MFCRKVVFYSLVALTCDSAKALPSRVVRRSSRTAAPLTHLQSIVSAMPHLCRVCTVLACGRDRPGLLETGLWKLAQETFVFLVEDTLPAVEKCEIGSGLVA